MTDPGKEISPVSAYRPEIDGLRAIAVLAVIASHAGEPFSSLLRGGFLGVDIFFVLSGFLITGILTREVRAGTFSLTRFYERRARRILPAFLLVSLVSIPAAWEIMSPLQLVQFAQSLIAQTAFASNIYFWMTTGYFGPDAETVPMIHMWSLAVEEQFYFLFPLAFLALWRWRRVLPGLCLMLVLGLVIAQVMITQGWYSAAFYLLPSRAWELLSGAVAGYCVAQYGLPDKHSGPMLWRVLGRFRNQLALAGLACIAASIVFFSPYHRGFYLLAPIGATTLVLLCTHPGGIVYWVLTRKVMIGIGLISYSAYLWHQPVFAFARLHQLTSPSALTMMALTGLVLFLALVSWFFVERPFRSRKFDFAYVGAGLCGAMAFVAAFGLTGILTSGFKSERFSAEFVQAFDTMEPSPLRNPCHNQPPETACIYNGPAPATLAVFGDSHGVELAYGLAGHLEQSQHSVLHLTRSGCPPALSFVTTIGGCTDWTKAALSHLEETQSLSAIVMVYRHAEYLFGPNEHAYPDLPDEPGRIVNGSTKAEKRSLYWASFKEMVTRLSAAGHMVFLVKMIPEIAYSAETLTMHALRDPVPKGDLHIPSVSRQYYDARSGAVNAQLEQIARDDPGVLLFDATDAFCDDQTCYAVRNGKALYFDSNHPSIFGAEQMARFFPQISAFD